MSTAALPAIERVDPLRFPLHGSRLIEASAGTGKTYTIAALYLRLVLGHGQADAYVRPLTPPEILVVTFTDAATKELRDRIRARLSEAAAAFDCDPDEVPERPPGEDLLHDLRASYPPAEWPGCARKLQLAAEWMDEAAVSTIHGWCHRMLREHAFDSDNLFTQTLEADQSELFAEAVRDYWRTFFYPLDAAGAARVLRWWASPAVLTPVLARLCPHTALLNPTDPPAAPPQHTLQAAAQAHAQELAALKAPWPAWADELQALLDAAVAAKQVNGHKLRPGYYLPWLDKLRAWAGDPEAVLLDLTKAGWERLTPTGLAEAWKVGSPPDHPALHALTTLQAQLKALNDWPQAKTELLRHAAHWVAARLASEQQRRAQLGFNDLLVRLHAALGGPNGERLAEMIRRQFPVALIDEFQDTDPVQYGIFNAVYRVADPCPHTALVLIGDPKQAIYAFRGADIHTYLAARRDTTGRHYTLDTNFRSTQSMVDAVNHCFGQAEARPDGQGAFLFRSGNDNPLPFLPVRARGRAQHLVIDGAPAPALTCWHLPPEDAATKGRSNDRLAATTASEIVRLLQLAAERRAGFADAAAAQASLQVLRPADMAVLVNTGTEARAVRAALAARGVRSVYLSDSESVYRSTAAGELQRWLEACAEPDDGRRLRAALATATLGQDWAALDRLNRDELAWEARVLQFRGYREAWQRRGVLPMLRRLLNDFGVPARLLSQGDERQLTDLLHLAELLQQASALLDGEHALIRHLADQRAEAAQAQDARRQRLESDADLVQVVTVHKSKGLEYPLVFLPFAHAARRVKADDVPLTWHDDSGAARLSLLADDTVLARADRERLGEDLRKLYVALTRARHATWMGVAATPDLRDSAIGYLLGEGVDGAGGDLAGRLQAWATDCPAIVCQPAPAASATRHEPAAETALPSRPRPLQIVPREAWWVASYSALRVAPPTLLLPDAAAPDLPDDPGQPGPLADSAAGKVFAERADAVQAMLAGAREAPGALPPDAPAPTTGSVHDFPRGAHAGSFLHTLMEWAGLEGFARVWAEPAGLRDLIARRCQVRGWSAWIAPLHDWLHALLDTALPVPGAGPLRLAALVSFQVELEFWFAAHRVDTLRLDTLVTQGTLDGAARPALLPGRLNGMLKGFIDLVLEHEGRYYVADYKSNWLGTDDASYTPQAMREAVLHHRYDLQYVLYLVALQRLLRARLPDYDYDRHVGGALYLFLRGTRGPACGVHAERPPRALIDAVDALFRATPPGAAP